MNYSHTEIEPKWQKIWEEKKIFQTSDTREKPKTYFLVEFPYPSGAGLHLGHPRSYTALDILARKARMEGKNVLFPIGWDAFGLPTENYAIKVGRPPQEITKENTDIFRRQLKSLGLSFDWDREINTTDPEYYKWTQWIFLKLFEHKLAYKARANINWCPSCKTGLANEEVVAGKCERCGALVEKREKEQWLLAITKYADRLIDDLDKVDYLEKIKIQQRNWIGRSYGARIFFQVKGSQEKIEVFTTRPDTLYGATFVVLAPEQPLIEKNKKIIENWSEVEKYIIEAKKKSEIERLTADKEKTGIEIKGLKAINPANNQEIPIFVADYVLLNYGTGAIMAVPAHDERDFAFAKKYHLPIIKVIKPVKASESSEVFSGEGKNINSDLLDGLLTVQAKKKIIKWLEEKKLGSLAVDYKLRDWIFSRQHYWGEPIPIVYCRNCWETQRVSLKDQQLGKDYVIKNQVKYAIVPLPEDQLPLELPVVKNYQPTETGESPLALMTDWVKTKCPVCDSEATRETDTMPNWAGSSWYFIRYLDPHNQTSLAAKDKIKYWLPVDLYNGGMEHTTLHLLYSRFWYKFLFDIGVVPTSEPYQKRVSHGLVLADDSQKMSKSRGNVINPDDLVTEFGADALRLFEMFIGPFDQPVSWQDDGIKGTRRFLEKVSRLADRVKVEVPAKDLEREINLLIKKVSADLETMGFNTSVAALMEFSNLLEKELIIAKVIWEPFLKIMSVFTPHLASELWSKLYPDQLISLTSWPSFDQAKTLSNQTIYVIQINGRLRGQIKVSTDKNKDEIINLTKEDKSLEKFLEGQTIDRVIFVPNKVVNFVLKS